MTKIIDTHVHLWKYTPQEFGWISSGMGVLKDDYLFDKLLLKSKETPAKQYVLVQARQSLDETRFLLSVANSYPEVLGVVGWGDIRSPMFTHELNAFKDEKKLVGFRHLVQDEADDNFILGDNFNRGVDTLTGKGYLYEILIFPRQMPAAIEFMKRHSKGRFVLDHAAKPRIGTSAGMDMKWAEYMKVLASFANLSCKLSGLLTEAVWGKWKVEDFKPYMELLLELFGPDRLMLGSDWPVCILSGSYKDSLLLGEYLKSKVSAQEWEKIAYLNAKNLYVRV